jgi:hypothetical protein
VGAKYGYAKVNRKTGELRYVKKLWEDPEKANRYVHGLARPHSLENKGIQGLMDP